MSRVLVVSYASINAPHRTGYEPLTDHGWEVHILAPAAVAVGDKAKTADARPSGARYELHTSPVAMGANGRISIFTRLSAVLRSVKPDVVFAEYDPGSLIVLHAAVHGVPVVCFSVENIDHHRIREALSELRSGRIKSAARDALVALLDATGSRVAAGLAVINHDGAEIYRARGWKQPLTVMPLGTDLRTFRRTDVSTLRRELGLHQAFVVGYFGRLIREKGVHLLIEALPRLSSEVRLLLDMFVNFQPGSYANELMGRADELGVRDRIVTIDVPHGDVARYMSCCDAIVLPSLSSERWKEQFGRVIPEAMACEVPVIGSRSGNIPRLIGEAGLLFDENSLEGLISAIQELYAAPDLRSRLGRVGRKRVADTLSIEQQAIILDRLLRDALASSRGISQSC